MMVNLLRDRLFRTASISTVILGLLAPPISAQSNVRIDDPAYTPNAARFSWLTRPYQTRDVPAIHLGNSSRFDSLIKAGNLYLSSADVVALAIENSIDVEVQRYAPLLAREVLKRAESGGILRNVGAGVAQGPTSVSLTGVSTNATGVGGVGGVTSGGGIITQLGPSIASLDPTVSLFGQFQHTTTPQSNTILTGTTSLQADTRSYQASYSQNWNFGLNAQLTYGSTHTKVNSQFFSLNPYTNGQLDLTVTQNLLQGFGSAVNGRNIKVQKNNLKVTDLQVKQQVIATVSSALNLYWDLVSFVKDQKARDQAVATAQQLFDDNKKQVELGSLAPIEVTRAQSQLYQAKQDLVISQTNLMQQETVLKNVISRTGVATSDLADVHIIPLDSIVVPATEDIRPVDELVAQAMANRLEIEQARINLDSNNVNLVGIKNSLKPTFQVFTELTNNGLTGDLSTLGAIQGGLPYLSGGYSNLIAQILRRNYPNYSAGFSLNIPLRNRAAQSDYVTSLIEVRQNELSLRKQQNQVRVDVQNAVIGVQQARARYDAAVQARVLSEQTVDSDQKRYALGASTAYQVIQDQRDLATSQSSEVQAMANYSHARISYEQSLGIILDKYNITMDEVLSGKVKSAPSSIPAVVR